MQPQPAPAPERKPDPAADANLVASDPKLLNLRLKQVLADLQYGPDDQTKLRAALELLDLGDKGLASARKVISIAAGSNTEIREILWRLIESWSLAHKLPLGPIKRQLLAAENAAALMSEGPDADKFKATNLRILRTLINLKNEKGIDWLDVVACSALFPRNKPAAFSALCSVACEENHFRQIFQKRALQALGSSLSANGFEPDSRRLSDLMRVGVPAMTRLMDYAERSQTWDDEVVRLVHALAEKHYGMYKELLKHAFISDEATVELVFRACRGICDRHLVPVGLSGLSSGKAVIIDKALEILEHNKKFLNSSDLLEIAKELHTPSVQVRLELLRLLQARGRENLEIESQLLFRLDVEMSPTIFYELLFTLRVYGGVRALGELIGMLNNPKYLSRHGAINDAVISIRERLHD